MTVAINVVMIAVCVAIATVASIEYTVAIPISVVVLLGFSLLWRRTFRAGVRETPAGILCLEGGYGWDTAELAWREIVAFTYESSRGVERIRADLRDGTHRLLPAAQRCMVWRGGETDDFAALLAERLREMAARPHGRLVPDV